MPAGLRDVVTGTKLDDLAVEKATVRGSHTSILGTLVRGRMPTAQVCGDRFGVMDIAGMSRTAPIKNMTASIKVKELATVALFSSSVSGTTKSPVAEGSKEMGPSILMAARST
jgi:hypothetical protein